MGILSRYFGAWTSLLGLSWLHSLWSLLAMRGDLAAQERDKERSERDRRASPFPCVPIDRPEFIRPDPLIYSQGFLMAQGLAVTWDNPDIVLEKDGKPAASSALEPKTTYEIVARIWNASPFCPVVSMPVYFSFLSFGIGAKSEKIGKTWATVGVKGGPDCPAFARMKWTTPPEQGHYCLQVLLAPPDDLNYLNNLGQENTQVVKTLSPAKFTFRLRNPEQSERQFRFEVDAYRIPKPDPCDDVPVRNAGITRRRHAGRVEDARLAYGERERIDPLRVAKHRRGAHPLPEGWHVEFKPNHPALLPEQEITVEATAHPPEGFAGEQTININAFAGDAFAGGVTVTVTSID